jgi:putative peptide zinc metalloprotease protein
MNDFLKSLLKRGLAPYAIAAVVLLAGVTGVLAETGTLPGATPTPTPSASDTSNGSASTTAGYPAAGGGDNIVQVVNHSDGHFRMDGRVKLDQIPGPNVGPKNEGISYASCTGCQTMAVALQIDLVSPSVHNFQPLNKAQAVNMACNSCDTFAWALQYVITVDDPTQVPSDVRDLMQQMDATLRDIKVGNYTVSQAIARVEAVIAQFKELAGSLNDQRDMATNPTTPGASPMPNEASPSTTPSVSGSPTESPTPSSQPSPSPSG